MNDGMGRYVVSQLVKAMTRRRIQVDAARVLVMGLAFKENCPDLRNTRVVDIIAELAEYNCKVDVYDPWVSADEAEHEYGIKLTTLSGQGTYDAIIIAVPHAQFRQMGSSTIRLLGRKVSVIYDLKYVLPPEGSDLRL
jgi:UDP-N-acetyl-D-galactosamine dehydrogenase